MLKQSALRSGADKISNDSCKKLKHLNLGLKIFPDNSEDAYENPAQNSCKENACTENTKLCKRTLFL